MTHDSHNRSAHVTLSGGLLAGPDVLRVEDTRLRAPERLKVGAIVELQDGAVATVIRLRWQRLASLGIFRESADLELADGRVITTSKDDVASVLRPADAGSPG